MGEVGSERCNVASFEDAGRGHQPRNMGSLQMLEEARKPTLPGVSGKEGNPADTSIFAH